MPEYVLPDINAEFDALDEFTQGYIECAFFCDASPDNEELENAGFEDLATEALARMVRDCDEFQNANAAALEEYYEHRPPSHAGHDLWLTRNRHGAGFWDRGLPGDLGQRLTDAAHAMGSRSLYLGDNGYVYEGEG